MMMMMMSDCMSTALRKLFKQAAAMSGRDRRQVWSKTPVLGRRGQIMTGDIWIDLTADVVDNTSMLTSVTLAFTQMPLVMMILRHDGRDAARRAGSSATCETCFRA